MTQTQFLTDSLTASTTSLVSSAVIVQPPNMNELHTIYIPLITGILAPLVKELIITLRENRKRKKEQKETKEK